MVAETELYDLLGISPNASQCWSYTIVYILVSNTCQLIYVRLIVNKLVKLLHYYQI